ncbi:MAG: potassium-transporting ATPase subunit A [Sphaerospermopsis sp. SIO1G2]|nr:potassium-transporting ATPase subunit A [Sphaerospermopsis sp. SIO1G2]
MGQGFLQIALTLCIVITITPLLGKYIACVFMEESTILDPIMNPIETIIYFIGGISRDEKMSVGKYIRALISINLIMGILVYLLISFQGKLPINPNNLGMPTWDIVLHTTVSFLTNTDQQHYVGETTLSHFSQTAALGFLMFTSAGTGLAVGIAFIRGLTGKKLGNFYIDITRAITRILLPLSVIGAIALIALDVPQTLEGTLVVETLEGAKQYIARGPVAGFEMIKLLGNNGGGFFAANSAHPFENPNGATNLIEIIAMIIIPASLIHTYGVFTNNRKQSWLLFWMVFIIFVILIWIASVGELQGNPIVNQALDTSLPNLEGKEQRFGWSGTVLWAITTTATMSGAVNGMYDSLMPQGLFAALLTLLGQMMWGGQGTGTAHLFIYLMVTIFVTGLMVGRTPEIFGRKIEQKEIFFISIILLIHPLIVLVPSAIALAYPTSLSGISNPGFHGISQVVYEYASAATNNGSGLEGLQDNTLWCT